MERNYSKRTFSTHLLSLFVLIFASSCVVYQNVPDEDGIYSSEKKESRVIVANSDEHREYENNYFTKELERIDQINGTDIFTDIETYTSVNDTIPLDSINDYTPNRAWGYGDNEDVVVNINLNNIGFGNGGYWNLYDPYFSYGFYNPWFSRPYYGWGFGGYGWGRWGRPFYNPFYSPFGVYHPFYHGLAGYRSARAWRYGYGGYYYGTNNYRYGRRYAYNNTFGRNAITNRRSTSSTTRRNSSVYRRSSTTRRTRSGNSTNTTRRRNSSTIRRNSNSNTRRRSTINRSSRSSNTRSATRRSSTRSSSRATRSSGSSRSSSSRSRGSSRRRG